MSSTLALFARNTDANQSLKGFEYQRLRTIEQWVSNRVQGTEEWIYCEYEDDIYQLNPATGEKTFTQVKLYGSKSFNFGSEEIRKAIVNFFFLYREVHGNGIPVTFVFETNTHISKAKGNAEADLLLDWYQRQVHLDEAHIAFYLHPIRALVLAYLQARVLKNDEKREQLQQAIRELDNFSFDFWERFIKAIRWNFSSEDTDSAMKTVVERIKGWITKLPFPSAAQSKHALFSSLYLEVSNRLVQDEPEDRRLTNQRVDMLALAEGDTDDVQYKKIFELWQDAPQISGFSLGEYYEVFYSAEYALVSPYLETHRSLWTKLVEQYVVLDSTPEYFREECIILLTLLHIDQKTGLFLPSAPVTKLKTIIEKMLAETDQHEPYPGVKLRLAIIKTISGSIAAGKIDISVQQMNHWFTLLGAYLQQRVVDIANPNTKCEWLMLLVDCFIFPTTEEKKLRYPDLLKEYCELLLCTIPTAPLFNVSQLNGYILQYIKWLLQFRYHESIISYLESLADRITPFVSQQSGEQGLGISYYKRALAYGDSDHPSHQLKTLDLFHKSAFAFSNAASHELYSFVLSQISVMYANQNLNLAAKQYALAAYTYSIFHDDKDGLQRAIELIIYSDFKQGSWITTLADGTYYIQMYTKMSQLGIDDRNVWPMRTLSQLFSVVKIMARISPQTVNLALSFWDAMSAPGNEEAESLLALSYEHYNWHGDNWQQHLLDRLDAAPINDIGLRRTLQFKAMGATWTLRSDNDETGNKLLEEFCALFQIALLELCNYPHSFEWKQECIVINLSVEEEWSAPTCEIIGTVITFEVIAGTSTSYGKGKKYSHAWHAIGAIWTILRVASTLTEDQAELIREDYWLAPTQAYKFRPADAYRKLYHIFYENVESMKQGSFFEESMIEFPIREGAVFQKAAPTN